MEGELLTKQISVGKVIKSLFGFLGDFFWRGWWGELFSHINFCMPLQDIMPFMQSVFTFT